MKEVITPTISVSPNPVHDYLELQGAEAVSEVQVYSLSGQCLLRTVSRRIDVSDLTPGIYLVHAITTDGKQYKSKIIKE